MEYKSVIRIDSHYQMTASLGYYRLESDSYQPLVNIHQAHEEKKECASECPQPRHHPLQCLAPSNVAMMVRADHLRTGSHDAHSIYPL